MAKEAKEGLLKSNHPGLTVDLHTGVVTAVSARFMSELFPLYQSSDILGRSLLEIAGDDASEMLRAYQEIKSLWRKYPRDLSDRPGNIYDPVVTPKIEGKRRFLALTPQTHDRQSGQLTVEFFDYTHILQDPLTGLQRRHTFLDNAEKMLSSSSREGKSVSFTMLDVDSFKSVNEQYGYTAGDDTLRTLGQVLLSQIRIGDQVCRYGGEEFAIAEPIQNIYTAMIVGDRIRDAVQQSTTETVDLQHLKLSLSCTASIGIALHIPSDGYPTDSVQSLQSKAEIAMKSVKKYGKNGVGVYIDGQSPIVAVFNFQPDGWYRVTIVDQANQTKKPQIYYLNSITLPEQIYDENIQDVSYSFLTDTPHWFDAIYKVG